nr:hypothetical protein [Alphaproteobacteria bacterium]
LYNITQQDADYDGALPVKIFGQLCAGENIVNASNGECGARVTEALHGLYQSAKIGGLVKIGELQ